MSSRIAPLRIVVVATIGLALIATGCGQDFPQSTLAPRSDAASEIHRLLITIFWWAVVVFVIVEGLLVYAVWRFRERDPQVRPRVVHGHTLMEIGWTLAPAVILVMIAVPTIRSVWLIDRPTTDAAALEIEVIGHQWWWEFRYPELDVVTANEMHAPVGRTVSLSLESADVIHSFWFPRAAGKRDVVPGHRNQLWFRMDSAGTYMGQCAEFCGESHALMGMRLVVQDSAAFEAWAQTQRQPAAESTDSLVLQGKQAFLTSACIGCHRVQGTHAQGVVGPDLTHVGSRQTIAAGVLENEPTEMARWLRDPEAIKPGVLMPDLGLSEEQIAQITAYLESLK